MYRELVTLCKYYYYLSVPSQVYFVHEQSETRTRRAAGLELEPLTRCQISRIRNTFVSNFLKHGNPVVRVAFPLLSPTLETSSRHDSHDGYPLPETKPR